MSSSSNSNILSDFQNNMNNPEYVQGLTNGTISPDSYSSAASVQNWMVTKFNNLVTAQTNAAICDASCQYDASLNALYKAMENARLNEIKAPYEYEQAEEAYYAFLGQSMPNNFQEQKYREKYNVLMEQYRIQLEEIFHKDKKLNDNYHTMYINTNNSYELYLDILNTNEKLRKQFNTTASNIFTNDRKTMYENQGLKTIQFHGKILYIIHILLVIFFIFAIFYFKTTLTIYNKIFFIFIIILQPTIHRIVMFIVHKTYNSVKQLLPKNVYLTL